MHNEKIRITIHSKPTNHEYISNARRPDARLYVRIWGSIKCICYSIPQHIPRLNFHISQLRILQRDPFLL